MSEMFDWIVAVGLILAVFAAAVVALPVFMWFVLIAVPNFLGPWYHYWLHLP